MSNYRRGWCLQRVLLREANILRGEVIIIVFVVGALQATVVITRKGTLIKLKGRRRVV